ncbi:MULTISPECIES: dynamin family protein [unclassified Lysinibacillus]|uniref:dynamin family protein n=1 Tax=unclassified Lysinibacillus TaxID=2636778 RepID=UPI00372D0AC0
MTKKMDLFSLDDSDLFAADDDLFDFSLEKEYEAENLYLADSAKGLNLISNLLGVTDETKSKLRNIRRLDTLIDNKLLQSINKIQLKNEVHLYQELVKLSDKLFEQNKVALLKKKKTIGIGGQFSAGKSKFINSVIGETILPEDQVPTTSIATYIVKGDNLFIEALTKNNQSVQLDLDAVKALSHAFYSTYNLGFSHFINNLVISTPVFPYESIAILDTPGYSKVDTTKKQAITDNEKALMQLKSVDYLIWLIDVENGVIKQADIDFIELLNMKNPVLIVFNKCDKKTESDVENIINTTKEYLKKSNIPLYEVVAYSAQDEKEYLNRNYLKTYFKEINRKSNTFVPLEEEIQKIINQLEHQIDEYFNAVQKRRNDVGNFIFKSDDISEIQTLTKVYAMLQQEIKEISNCRKNLAKTKEQILNQFNALVSGGFQ